MISEGVQAMFDFIKRKVKMTNLSDKKERKKERMNLAI